MLEKMIKFKNKIDSLIEEIGSKFEYITIHDILSVLKISVQFRQLGEDISGIAYKNNRKIILSSLIDQDQTESVILHEIGHIFFKEEITNEEYDEPFADIFCYIFCKIFHYELDDFFFVCDYKKHIDKVKINPWVFYSYADYIYRNEEFFLNDQLFIQIKEKLILLSKEIAWEKCKSQELFKVKEK